jgi:D-glycero-D-manno-heptose 1,7-bisphosphate phosphatase
VGIDDVSRRAVFLDRDGVLNRAIVRDGRPFPPQTLDEFEILPEVPDALARLRAGGFALIVVTNQPDVARGTQARAVVEAMHEELRRRLPIIDVLVCYHDDRSRCQCRKPAPGLLLRAAAEHGIDLPASFLVGDRWRDVEAGREAGCRTVFIDRRYAEALKSEPDARVRDLAAAAAWILERTD